MELVLVTTLATAKQDTRDQDAKKQVRTSGYVNHLCTLSMYLVTIRKFVNTACKSINISSLDSTHGRM